MNEDEADLSILFTPDAIREHFAHNGTPEEEAVFAMTDDELRDVGNGALTDDRVWEAFHDVLTDAVRRRSIDVLLRLTDDYGDLGEAAANAAARTVAAHWIDSVAQGSAPPPTRADLASDIDAATEALRRIRDSLV
jgi:hypothetical protein